MNKKDKEYLPSQNENKEDKIEFPGYPDYPPKEDIYKHDKEEEGIDPEDIRNKKKQAEKSKPGNNNKTDFYFYKSGSELDVPGSELDDPKEDVGSEDEENNYYSLGGDDHDKQDGIFKFKDSKQKLTTRKNPKDTRLKT